MRKFTEKLWLAFLSFAMTMLLGLQANAQETERVGQPQTGAMGITVSAADIETRSRIADMQPKPFKLMKEHEVENRRPRRNPAAPEVAQWPPATTNRNNSPLGTDAVQGIHSNFTGITLSEAGSFPPDCMGDIGTTQVCIASNGRLKFFNRNTVCATAQTTLQTTSTAVLAAPAYNVNIDAFFASVSDPSGTSDPHVRFDRLTSRWFIVIIDLKTASNKCLVAVSSGATVTGLASFTFFSFVYDALPPVPPTFVGGFFDYPTLGIDANALYIGGSIFDNTAAQNYIGSSLFVIRKSSILGAGPMVTTAFHQVGTGTTGLYVGQGVHNTDPTATQGYFLGVDAGVFSKLDIHRVSTPGATPTLSSLISLTVPTTSAPLGQVSPGTTVAMDALDDRLFAATIVKNKITGASTLWAAHNIAVTSAGVGATTGTGRRNGSRFYEITNLATTPSLLQTGTQFDAAATNPRGFWIPSITATGQGHAVMGFTTAGAVNSADVGVTGRYASDALGTLQTFQLATASSTNYTPAANPGSATVPRRWGDYSQTVVDPLDDMTTWTFQEYCNNTGNYGVRAVQLKAPPPATPAAIGTIGCGVGKIVTINITGTATNNSGFFDPGADVGGPGFNRLNVTSTGGVTVSNIVFTSPTAISVTLNFTAATLGSTQTLTITNPDCQFVTATYTLPASCGTVYTFNGNGNWSNVANWVGGTIPPTTLTSPNEIVIDPVAGGECVLDIPTQTIATGAKVTVVGTKKFRIVGNLINQ
jgi:hypothetical protein